MKRKRAKAPEPDLFSFSTTQPEPQKEPEHVSAFAPPPEAFRPSRIIQECEIADDQGVLQTYKIENAGSFCTMYIWDKNDWRRLRLTQEILTKDGLRYTPYYPGDEPYIPNELFRISEDMMDWSAGYTRRPQELCEQLRPRQRHENIAI
jgi:hypothetical protein